MLDNKIPTPVNTRPQEKFLNPAPILTHRCFHQYDKGFSSKKTFQISILNKSLIAGYLLYLNCSAFLVLQTD